MTKRFLLWTIIVILAVGTAVFVRLRLLRSGKAWAEMKADASQPVSEQQAAEYAREIYGSNSPVLPVSTAIEPTRPVRLALGSLGLADDDQNGRLSDLVLTELTGAQGLNLVERQSLEAVLRELNLSRSGLVRAKDAVRVGKLLKADWFLLGTRATIHGADSIVLRVVDARTGILRDAGVFSRGKPLAQLAGDIAGFVRQSRQNASSAKTPVFLAIGTFEDLSVNNRQAGFPTQLRGYLTAAYQGGNVTLLEREYVESLLQEVRLDLAGLTEDSGSNGPAPLQSAYWLVTGYYQSFETTNLEVELTLDVQHIFGECKRVTLRGPPGEPVNRQIKQAIDRVMDQNQARAGPTRKSEIEAQMKMGKELAGLNPQLRFSSVTLVYGFEDYQYFDFNNWRLAQREGAKRKRNLEEAIRTFETVLLLDPGNREAKMNLAACFRSPIIQRLDEARGFYREIIDSQIQDQWTGLAQKALVISFNNIYGRAANPTEKARWFEAAVGQSTNSPAADFYSKQAREAGDDVTLERGASPEAEGLAEQRLFQALQSFKDALDQKVGGIYDDAMGMDVFVETFGTNRAARRLVELLPKMRKQLPELEPYFLSAVVTMQQDTNAPVIAEFEQQLTQISQHRKQVFMPYSFWPHLTPFYIWSMEHKLFQLAAQEIEAKRRAGAEGALAPFTYDDAEKNQDSIKLAYAYRGMEHWQQAREIFESLSNQPVVMLSRGPWGRGSTTVLPGKEAAYCAEKLGQPSAREAREFDMDKACYCLCAPAAFEVDESGLWVGVRNQLLRLDFDLKTNLAVALPKEGNTPVDCLCLTPSTVWIGTDGDGLIAFDKTNHQCNRLTEQDGLLMNNISCLNLAGTVLWIGYGHREHDFTDRLAAGEGGLGRLDLSTRQITSFPRPLSDRETGDRPTRCPVMAIAQGNGDDVWFIVQGGGDGLPRRFRTQNQVWDEAPNTRGAVQRNCISLASDQKRLFTGQNWNPLGPGVKSDLLGVTLLDFKEGKWRSLKAIDGLPSGAVTTVAPDGQDLWVGGRGYIALVDPERDKVLKFAHVQTYSVDRIQIGGGFLWAEYDWLLYRALLQNIR